MLNIIETEKLSKYYGKFRGVIDLDFAIKEGEIFGFLGPNGAGKTTTMRLLLHLIKPSSGSIKIFNYDSAKHYREILKEIGYLPGDLILYDRMTGKQLLDFSRSFYGHKDTADYEAELINRLDCELAKPFRKLSRGNKQKIGILLALFHKPRLLILDEPTNGLDPVTQSVFYQILAEAKQRGTTILFSSHNLSEVEKICDRAGIIKEGKLVSVKTLDELRRNQIKRVEIIFTSAFDPMEFTSLKGVTIKDRSFNSIKLDVPNLELTQVLRLCAKYEINDINVYTPSLEEMFLTYYS